LSLQNNITFADELTKHIGNNVFLASVW